MRIRKIMKKNRIVAAIVAVLSVICMYLPAAQAADMIQTEALCSLTLQVPPGSVYISDSGAPKIPVNLYRVAEVSATREFTMSGDYGVDIQTLSENKNTDWANAAKTASEHLDGKTVTAATNIDPATGRAVAENLSTGMYLVMPETAISPTYEYTFEPYFISLPHNQYYETGVLSDDAWNYNPVSEVKIGQEARYGSLQIVKNLTRFNTSLGDATFIFSIEGRDGTRQYSNVVSLTFTGEEAGQNSVIVENIPVGMEVTVTEYQGTSSYEAVSDTVQSTVIIADGMEGAPATVEFTNQYNDGANGGNSVENQFSYNENGGWDVNQRYSSTTGQ